MKINVVAHEAEEEGALGRGYSSPWLRHRGRDFRRISREVLQGGRVLPVGGCFGTGSRQRRACYGNRHIKTLSGPKLARPVERDGWTPLRAIGSHHT